MAEFLYQNLIDWFQEQLTKGALSAGDKMPSLRSVAKEQGVSLNTAIHGYELLAKDGWIESRPKSGYFVCHRSQLRAAIPLLGEQHQTLSKQFGLTLSQRAQDQITLTGEYNPLMQADLLNMASNGQKCIGQGEKEARQSVVQYLSLLGIQSHLDAVWLANNALAFFTQAVHQFTNKQDNVLVITPCDHRLTQTLLSLGRVPVVITAGAHGADLDLAKTCIEEKNIRLVVLPGQFALPAGQLISNLSLRRWVALLDDTNTPAIEWDMTSYLGYKGSFPITYKSLDTHARILYIGGFEHLDQYGNDLAWALLDGQFSACRETLFASQLTPSRGMQMALSHGLDKNISRKLNAFTRAIWRKSESIKSQLEAEFGNKMSLLPAKGGRFLWLQCDLSLTEHLKALCLNMESKPGLLLGGRVFYEENASEWIGLNVSCNEIDQTLLWLMTGIRHLEASQIRVEDTALAEEDAVEAVERVSADAPLIGKVQKTNEKPNIKSNKDDIEPVYNPMLDLINHDFG